MPEPGPKYAFTHDDLSVYERIDPDQFPNHDDVDSEVAELVIADDGKRGTYPYPRPR
jgi:hypothetical protein